MGPGLAIPLRYMYMVFWRFTRPTLHWDQLFYILDLQTWEGSKGQLAALQSIVLGAAISAVYQNIGMKQLEVILK